MGDETLFQPLTREDRITVVLYRAGIVISSLALAAAAFLSRFSPAAPRAAFLLLAVYAGTGLSVFFIHLYVGKFHRFLKKLYLIALLCLGALYILGQGDVAAALDRRIPALLLLPLAGCLGFVTAKEAFCFRLLEGYLLAMLLPMAVVLYAAGLPVSASVSVLAAAAALHVIFTLRKVFMPIHYDIGDKSAYQP
ncbi:MAG: hypothetical protein OHK006_23250 [Thermodesulfovibrionales bacterium]